MNTFEEIGETNKSHEYQADFNENIIRMESQKIDKIKTEIELTKEGNFHNDCGALSALMVIKSINPELSKNFDLDKIKDMTNKEGEEGILPGNLCKALSDLGLTTEYYTNIDWAKCTLDPNKYFQSYDDRIKYLPSRLFKSENNIDGMIDKEKLSKSSSWLLENNSIINRNPVNFETISKLLGEGKKLIALIHGSHYVVITGIDNENVYINNPLSVPSKDVVEKEKFEKSWLQNLNSKELIVVSEQ